MVPLTAIANPILWNVYGGTFQDGGTITGSLTYDASTNTYSSVDITTFGGGISGSTYTFIDPSHDGPFTWLLSPSPGQGIGTPVLYLNLNTPLTNAGGTIPFSIGPETSFEGACANANCNVLNILRDVTGGGFTTSSGSPSLITLANLSNNVYLGSGGFGVYTSFTTNCSSNNGFCAVAYQNADRSQIVVAFRGTDFGDPLTALKNAFADTSFATGIPTNSLSISTADAAQFVRAIAVANPGVNITLTGQSLGGAIAQLVGVASGLTATVFDAPGAGQLYPQLTNQLSPAVGISSGGQITNYRIQGDQVSLAGTQFITGTTITLPAPDGTPFTYTLGTDPVQNVVNNLSTIEGLHSMSTMIGQIISNAQQVPTIGPNLSATLEQIIQGTSPIPLGLYEIALLLTVDVQQGLDYLFDPAGGTDFTLTAQNGSPGFQSVDLPTLSGVSSYELRYEIGNTWSPFQNLQPATQFLFAPNVDGIEFYAVDQFGSPLIVPGFLFDLTFNSNGMFAGTLDEFQPTPELSSIRMLVVSVLGFAGFVSFRNYRRRSEG